MAWNQVIGAIIGAAGGAAYGGYTSYRNAKKNADVYKKAALLYGYDTNKYSGENANQSMYSSGMQQGRVQNEGTMNAAAAQGQRGNSLMANALKGAANVGMNNSYDSGYNTGASNASTLNNAAFNRDTALAQQMMNQADINYKRDTALSQAGLNTAAGAANVYKDVVSDENTKEYNNKEGLPKADANDALRRIESIEFKYKPEMQKEMGLDNEEHVGVTAQSVEGTAFDDMVETGPNGYKQLDKQMMLEATLAGIASLRKELDELESGNNKITSDEECKVAEDAIESNPEKAASILPEGSDIQKEAEQAIDGGRDAEVNNDTVSKYIGLLNGSAKPDTVITDDGREISRDEYAAEMAQFREDNPEDILREREESKAAAREEAREKRAESNKLADMAREVAGETEEDDTTNKDSIPGLGFLPGLFNLGSAGSVSDSVPDGSVNLSNDELPEDGVNANFSSGPTSNSVSAEARGGETAATITGDATFTDSSDTADKSFGGAIETAQEDAAQLSVNSGSSGGMTAAAGNGGTVSSGATKSNKDIHSKEQKLPSNEEQTQDYSNTLSGDEMKDAYVQKLNEASKETPVEGVDSEPEMSTFNGVPFDKLDNDELKKLEHVLKKTV